MSGDGTSWQKGEGSFIVTLKIVPYAVDSLPNEPLSVKISYNLGENIIWKSKSNEVLLKQTLLTFMP